MKNLFYALFFVLFACTSPNTTQDMTLYNANLEIVKKAMACYETPQDFETFKTLNIIRKFYSTHRERISEVKVTAIFFEKIRLGNLLNPFLSTEILKVTSIIC